MSEQDTIVSKNDPTTLKLTHAFGILGFVALGSGSSMIDWLHAPHVSPTSFYFVQVSIGAFVCSFVCAVLATFRKKPEALLFWAAYVVCCLFALTSGKSM